MMEIVLLFWLIVMGCIVVGELFFVVICFWMIVLFLVLVGD